MFRRVYVSAPLPPQMWRAFHIQTASQASRMLPSLAPLLTLRSKGDAADCGLAADCLNQLGACSSITAEALLQRLISLGRVKPTTGAQLLEIPVRPSYFRGDKRHQLE